MSEWNLKNMKQLYSIISHLIEWQNIMIEDDFQNGSVRSSTDPPLSETTIIGENNHSKSLKSVLKDFSEWRNSYWGKFTTSCVNSLSLWHLSHCILHSSPTLAQEATLMAGTTKTTELPLSPVPRYGYCSNLATSIYHPLPPHPVPCCRSSLFQARAVEMSGAPVLHPDPLLKKPYSRHGSLRTLPQFTLVPARI